MKPKTESHAKTSKLELFFVITPFLLALLALLSVSIWAIMNPPEVIKSSDNHKQSADI